VCLTIGIVFQLPGAQFSGELHLSRTVT